jgi:hypothetical protein
VRCALCDPKWVGEFQIWENVCLVQQLRVVPKRDPFFGSFSRSFRLTDSLRAARANSSNTRHLFDMFKTLFEHARSFVASELHETPSMHDLYREGTRSPLLDHCVKSPHLEFQVCMVFRLASSTSPSRTFTSLQGSTSLQGWPRRSAPASRIVVSAGACANASCSWPSRSGACAHRSPWFESGCQTPFV